VALSGQPEVPELARAMERWRERLGLVPGVATMAAWQDAGLRLVVPGGLRMAQPARRSRCSPAQRT
jgi:hypothetical protein